MRAFAWFLAAILLALLIGACLAYPAYSLVGGIGHWAFHRVAERVAMLVLAAELVWLCRRLNLRHKVDFGYGLARRRFVGQVLLWGGVGIVTAGCGAAFLLQAKLRIAADGFSPSAVSLARIFLMGVTSGIAVALIEETVMRGAMHTAIERESGPWAAALLTAPLFAVLHFFANPSLAHADLAWRSGFELLLRSFVPLSHPALVLDAFLSWLAIGLILSLTRVLTGNIAVAIGLHAGWVVVLRMLQLATVRNAATAQSIWVGKFDGILGLWMIPWSIALALALWFTRRRWVPFAAVNGR
ncbi:MAG TPA: CPBP family intramembrane glutamic endopeptidase [Steroidobacteraceae bacterium]|nr:CPBP family intramembrane glutamic endopeptidase [Steroidobacteraceae bacterium]